MAVRERGEGVEGGENSVHSSRGAWLELFWSAALPFKCEICVRAGLAGDGRPAVRFCPLSTLLNPQSGRSPADA
jgi:hypothetical protein